MSEAAIVSTSKYWNADKKKFVISEQFKDPETGNPVGPVQYFEADSQDELIEKKDAAHKNAALKLYETRRANKLGKLLEPDKTEPILTFEERQFTADERVKYGKMLTDPNTAMEAHQIILEAKLGASLEKIRGKFRDLEIKTRVENIQGAVSEFKAAHPEFVESESNRDTFKKYMEKHELDWTSNNLEIAFNDLVEDGLIVIRAPKAEVTESAPKIEAAAPSGPATIPPAPQTPTPAIPAESEVRPKQSSSGLGRDNSSATPGVAPKAVGITLRDINKMSAAQYQEFIKDPENRKQVEALYKKS